MLATPLGITVYLLVKSFAQREKKGPSPSNLGWPRSDSAKLTFLGNICKDTLVFMINRDKLSAGEDS